MFSFIFSLLIGALAGYIAGRIMGSETSALRNIVLGILAMRPKRSRSQRIGFYIAALATFAFIYGIARMHNPAGWLLLLR